MAIDLNYWRGEYQRNPASALQALKNIGAYYAGIEEDLKGKYIEPERAEVEVFEGTPEQIAAAKKFRAAQKGELPLVKTEIIDASIDWSKEGALIRAAEIWGIEEAKAAKKRYDELARKLGIIGQLEAAKKDRDVAQKAADEARRKAGIKIVEEVHPDVQRLRDETEKIARDAEEAVAVATRADELVKGGVDDLDEYGNIVHRTVTKTEALDIARLEREATKAASSDAVSKAVIETIGTGLEISGVALDLLALASPTLAAKLRKITKVGRGVTAFVAPKARKAPKAIKVKVSKAKEVKALIKKVTKKKARAKTRPEVARLVASLQAGGVVQKTGKYILHAGEVVVPAHMVTRAAESARQEPNMKVGSKEAKAWGAKMRRLRSGSKKTMKRKTSTRTASNEKTKRRASTATRTSSGNYF